MYLNFKSRQFNHIFYTYPRKTISAPDILARDISVWTFHHKDISARACFSPAGIVVVFPQAPLKSTNVPGPTPVPSNCATAPWLPEEVVGYFVTPYVLEKLFDYSCSVELAGSFLGHAPTSSGKFV